MISISFTPRVMIIVSLLLLALLLATGSMVGLNLQHDWLLAHQEIFPKPISSTHETNAALIAAIPDAHLFGKAQPSLGALPLSSLQFKITGIVEDDVKENSKAYLSLSGGPSKIFRIGDNLPYGVKVFDITADAVILENDGHLEKLTIPREKLRFKPRNGTVIQDA